MTFEEFNIDKSNIPEHVAIIMDGNGRWAKKRLLPRTTGHKIGVERIKDILRVAKKLKIKYITLYAFSTENWKRPKEEVGVLMNLLFTYLKKNLKELNKEDVKLNIFGSIDTIPEKVKKEVENSLEITKNNKSIILNIAIDYGSRAEIVKAVKKITEEIKDNKIKIEDINEESFKNYLFTQNQPDPDLLIRTSGEERLSNFLLYQIAYSEFVFTETLWPDFTEEEFLKTIETYQKRNRRFGAIK